MSTDRIGILVVSNAEIRVSNGDRTGGLKLKPNKASMIKCVLGRTVFGSSTKGMWRLCSCF